MSTTPTEAQTPEPGYLNLDADSDDLQQQIRSRVRAARLALDLTQAELGKRIGVSRFTINRIEAGVTEVTPELADQLTRALDIPDLTALLARRSSSTVADTTRDGVVARMLRAPKLERVRVVLADDLNLYQLCYTLSDDDAVLRCQDIEIVVPTVHRAGQLLGAGSPVNGHLEWQLKRLLDLKKSEHYATNSLRIYESDDVIASVVIAVTNHGSEAAVWPPMPVRNRSQNPPGSTLPVGVTVDQHAIAQLDEHVRALIDDRDTIRSNEALCRVAATDAENANRLVTSPAVFTRYFTVGEDQEEDIEATEGTAVALILVTALCPRKTYGVARRVITYRRSRSRKDQRPSLFSNTVEDTDIRHARAADTGSPVDERRSTRVALAAALDVHDYLAEHAGVLPTSAFQLAAAREMSMYDLTIDRTRFVPVPLSHELELIRKPASEGRRRAAIAPRLLVLELGDGESEPELETLQRKADIEAVGTRDIEEATDLNDFLTTARDSGYLASLLAEHRIADR